MLSLHYANDDTQLAKLIKQTQTKVKSMIDDTALLTLVNQTLTNAELGREQEKSKKASKKSLRNSKPSSVSAGASQLGEIEVETNKLDMMLKVGGRDSQFSKKTTRTKVSPYTIDRLTI